MPKHTNKILLSLSFLFTTACVDLGTDSDEGASTNDPILDQACEQDSDCPGGYECEVEIEHGVTTSFCKPHGGDDDGGPDASTDDDASGNDDPAGDDNGIDPGDGGCPAGYELEIEHGQESCVPHGGGH